MQRGVERLKVRKVSAFVNQEQSDNLTMYSGRETFVVRRLAQNAASIKAAKVVASRREALRSAENCAGIEWVAK
jgi:hypothetical protein